MVKVALLIGISEYKYELRALPAAVKDIEAMRSLLDNSEIGGFDEVEILKNPDPNSMRYKIDTFFSDRKKEDLLLLYFSGHGIKDDQNKFYFATTDTQKSTKGDLFRSTAIPASFIHDVMNNSRAKRQVIILDCCFSAAFDPQLIPRDDGSLNLQEELGAEGRVVLTSSSSTQYSFEEQNANLSIYTHYLVEGIETGAGDRDEDGKISVLELHEYASNKVRETAPRMKPQLIVLKDMGFDIFVAKAKVTDPELRYRKRVENYAKRGEISVVGREVLNTFQKQLSLSQAVAARIEQEVLHPYQERLKNIEQYKQSFIEAVDNYFPLNEDIKNDLKDLQEILGLRQDDVTPIENRVLISKGKINSLPQNQVAIENKEEVENKEGEEPPSILPQYRTEFIENNKNKIETETDNNSKQSLPLNYASLKSRGLAFTIDLICSFGLFVILGFGTLPLTLILTPLLYYIIPEALLGQTLGKFIVGISVVDLKEKKRISFGISFSRFLVKFFYFVSVIGILGICRSIQKSNCNLAPQDRYNGCAVIINNHKEERLKAKKNTDFKLALIGQRFAAFVFDLVIYSAITSIWYFVFDNIFYYVTYLCIVPAIISINFYDAICEKFIGATLGKKITGIKITDLNNNKISFQKSLIRSFIKVISILSLGGGILATFIALSNRSLKQSFHDLFTKCIVVQSR